MISGVDNFMYRSESQIVIMALTKDIVDVVGFYQKAFTLILALALAEAFKQFVADKAAKSIFYSKRAIAACNPLIFQRGC